MQVFLYQKIAVFMRALPEHTDNIRVAKRLSSLASRFRPRTSLARDGNWGRRILHVRAHIADALQTWYSSEMLPALRCPITVKSSPMRAPNANVKRGGKPGRRLGRSEAVPNVCGCGGPTV